MSEGLLQAGTEVAGYRIERHIAHGGMGEVYEATQLSLDRRVALNLIAERLGTDERFRERFRREARSAASINHPNILWVRGRQGRVQITKLQTKARSSVTSANPDGCTHFTGYYILVNQGAHWQINEVHLTQHQSC